MIFFHFPGLKNVTCVFTNACDPGDISFSGCFKPGEIHLNRVQLFSALEPRGLAAWRECQQVHGDMIIIDPEPVDIFGMSAPFPEADGMMTSQTQLGLLIKTADCQPILFTDDFGAHIMAIHCGWRGNRMNFPASAVGFFCATYDLSPEQVWAVRGPSLGPNCAEFKNFASEWGKPFAKWYDPESRNMNLWQLTHDQLLEAGLPENHIFGIDICTKLNFTDWFSWRIKNTPYRQASIIWTS